MSPPVKGWGLALALVIGAVAQVGAADAALDPGGRRGGVPALEYRLTQVGRFTAPTHVAAPPGDLRRLFVVEKAGRVRLVLDGRVRARPFLDLRDIVLSTGNEQGLLSIAFAPDYGKSGHFYVYYVDLEENGRLVEYRRSRESPNRADPATRRELLLVEQFSGEHYGGLLLFGPGGRLYLGTGDGGLERERDPLRAQRDDDPHGKLLTVDRRTGAFEIVAKGFRNPWRYAFDRRTGALYVGDVGEYVRESVGFAPASALPGANFGWPCFEGGLAKPEFPAELCPASLPPLYEYAREGGNCSIVGGVVVRDPRLRALAGSFLYADYCLGEIAALRARSGSPAVSRSLRLYRPSVSSFGEDARRRVYVATLDGPVYRLDPRSGAAAAGTRPRSGRELFLASGCGSCHVLAAAGTTGTYGPNLDDARPPRSLVAERVTWGKNAMPSFKGRLTAAEIERIADFVSSSTGG
jgi:hypothetical protein